MMCVTLLRKMDVVTAPIENEMVCDAFSDGMAVWCAHGLAWCGSGSSDGVRVKSLLEGEEGPVKIGMTQHDGWMNQV